MRTVDSDLTRAVYVQLAVNDDRVALVGGNPVRQAGVVVDLEPRGAWRADNQALVRAGLERVLEQPAVEGHLAARASLPDRLLEPGVIRSRVLPATAQQEERQRASHRGCQEGAGTSKRRRRSSSCDFPSMRLSAPQGATAGTSRSSTPAGRRSGGGGSATHPHPGCRIRLGRAGAGEATGSWPGPCDRALRAGRPAVPSAVLCRRPE